jgi:hypothetical protein
MPRKLLLLEFNELCPSLLHKWMAAGRLPNFRRFHDQSQVYLTFADAEPPALEPWIQWYSIHTGLSFAQHRVFRLTEGSRADHYDLWTVLQKAGLRTANCSSMNCSRSTAAGCFFLPDHWSDARAFPDELDRFHRFITVQVREHTSREVGLRLRDALAFITFLAGHGLRVETMAQALWQLCHEAVAKQDVRWKRVTILDMLQFDLFAHYFAKLKPHFSTFFLNSTAHLQHAYWRHMDPGAFQARPDPQEAAAYQNAIFHGYRKMDLLLRRFFELEDREGVTLALATGLSQRPFLAYEEIGGQKFYRPRDINALLDLLSISPKSVDAVMAHEYVLRFELKEERARAVETLQNLTCEGETVFDVQVDGNLQIYMGSRLQTTVPEEALVQFDMYGVHRRPFYKLFYLLDEKKSGCHHPEGVFWVKGGRPAIHPHRISILDIFPTILEFLTVAYKPSENHPYRGRSRVCEWQGA